MEICYGYFTSDIKVCLQSVDLLGNLIKYLKIFLIRKTSGHKLSTLMEYIIAVNQRKESAMWKKICELLSSSNNGKEMLVLDIFPGNISFNIPQKSNKKR
jgi:hypothetical protein